MRVGIVDVHGDVAARATVAAKPFIVLDWPIGDRDVLALQASGHVVRRLTVLQQKGHMHQPPVADRDDVALRITLLDEDQAVALVAPMQRAVGDGSPAHKRMR
jgi:hypothetical protein